MVKLKLKIIGCLCVFVFLFAFLSVGLVQAVGSTIITVGGTPCDLAVTPDGRYVYVPTGKAVAVIDTTTNKLLTSINTGRSQGVAVTPDGEYVYVTNNIPIDMESGGSVSVISVVTNTVTSTVMVRGNPMAVVITPNGKYAYVLSHEPVLMDAETNLKKMFGLVSVIDTASKTVVTTVTTGFASNAITIAFNGNYAYVANSDGTLSVIDSSFKVETKNVVTENVNFRDIAISPDDKYLYVTASDEVLVVSVASNVVVATIDVFGYPSCVAVTSDGKYVYVTEIWNNAVFVINAATYVVEYAVGVGTSPQGVVMAPDGKCVYVANLDYRQVGEKVYEVEYVGTISVVSTDSKAVTTITPSRPPEAVNSGESGFNVSPSTDAPEPSNLDVSLQSVLVMVVLGVVVVGVVFLVVMRIKRKPKASFSVISDVKSNLLTAFWLIPQ